MISPNVLRLRYMSYSPTLHAHFYPTMLVLCTALAHNINYIIQKCQCHVVVREPISGVASVGGG